MSRGGRGPRAQKASRKQKGLGFRGLGFRGLGFRVLSLGFRVVCVCVSVCVCVCLSVSLSPSMYIRA